MSPNGTVSNSVTYFWFDANCYINIYSNQAARLPTMGVKEAIFLKENPKALNYQVSFWSRGKR